MTAYLLIVGDRDALGWILTASRTAFPSRNRAEVSALRAGDRLYLYTTRGCFKNPTRDRGRVIGTATVSSAVVALDDVPSFGGRTFPVGCQLRLGPVAPLHHGVDLAPIAPSLDAFARLGSNWSIGLRRPLVALKGSDAARLEGLLRPVVDNDPATIEPYARWFRRAADGRTEA